MNAIFLADISMGATVLIIIKGNNSNTSSSKNNILLPTFTYTLCKGRLLLTPGAISADSVATSHFDLPATQHTWALIAVWHKSSRKIFSLGRMVKPQIQCLMQFEKSLNSQPLSGQFSKSGSLCTILKFVHPKP